MGPGDDLVSVSPPQSDDPTDDLEVYVGSWSLTRRPGTVRDFSSAWTLHVTMTNSSRMLPVGIKCVVLEASRHERKGVDEVHPLTHIGKDVEGSNRDVPFSDSALDKSFRIEPATTITGKLRFVDRVPFDPGTSVALTLIVEESDGHRHTLELGDTKA